MPPFAESRAPNRVLDFGGWTDTHFAKKGRVTNLAVTLYANVTIAARQTPGATIHILDYGDRLVVDDVVRQRYGTKHDLLIAALKVIPMDFGLDIYISADAPPGCGAGSSAAITVAMLAGLSALAKRRLTPHQLAHLAHRIETEELGQECGVQDQIASAYGGISYIEIDNYPDSRVSPVPVDEATRFKLESRLLVVYEGRGRLSSDVHKKVIAGMEDPGAKVAETLAGLADCAERAKDALMASDLDALARIMDQNNGFQKDLHPDVATGRLLRIEEVAKGLGAAGAMINGAGGGGSITLLCEPGTRTVVARALRDEGFDVLPCQIAMAPAKAFVNH